jgi:hypothetical protein
MQRVPATRRERTAAAFAPSFQRRIKENKSMNRKDEQRHRKEKQREEKNKAEKAYEEQSQKERLPIKSAWVMVIGIVLTLLAVYTWMFWFQ